MYDCFKDLNRIEFVVTTACTGRCKHCSEEGDRGFGEHIDGDKGTRLLEDVCGRYKIDSLMTFGGEPLLYPNTVCKLHSRAKALGIPGRHLITNGFFSKDKEKIKAVAAELKDSGVNKIMLSVDAFHQEAIPLEPVMEFAKAATALGLNIKTHPAWLVSRTDPNPYNLKTKELLATFAHLGVEEGDGNIIFPAGNALIYLKEYFDPGTDYQSPYAENPHHIRTLSISPDGTVLGGNLNSGGILDIMEDYNKKH